MVEFTKILVLPSWTMPGVAEIKNILSLSVHELNVGRIQCNGISEEKDSCG